MKRFLILMACVASLHAAAQIDSTLLVKQTPSDSLKPAMNMDAIYNRQFLSKGHGAVAIGGYLESNWQHLGEDGNSLGNQFQFRRMSIFMASSITRKVKFLTEIEYENNPDEILEGKSMEIEIEYAAVDVELSHFINLRSGIILNPIGAFNQNHDGPKWEFVDRPIAMTQMLPATWSNPGVGFYGKKNKGNWMVGYEAYLTNGFSNSIIDNDLGKTYLPEANEDPRRWAATANGSPITTAKIAIRNNKIGEIGISHMGGVYNTTVVDGLIVDSPRKLGVFDLDMNFTLPKLNTNLIAEFAWVNVHLPADYAIQYGSKQHGGFLDIIQPVWKGRLGVWKRAQFNVNCRTEYVDWNVGTFVATGANIGEQLWSMVPGVSLRLDSQTVFRVNYRIQKTYDLFNNPPANLAGFSIGLATYF